VQRLYPSYGKEPEKVGWEKLIRGTLRTRSKMKKGKSGGLNSSRCSWPFGAELVEANGGEGEGEGDWVGLCLDLGTGTLKDKSSSDSSPPRGERPG